VFNCSSSELTLKHLSYFTQHCTQINGFLVIYHQYRFGASHDLGFFQGCIFRRAAGDRQVDFEGAPPTYLAPNYTTFFPLSHSGSEN